MPDDGCKALRFASGECHFRMNKYFCTFGWILAFLCVHWVAHGQNKRLIDSLELRVRTATVDSVKVMFLNKCAAYYIRYDISKAEEALQRGALATSNFSSNWSDSSSYLRHRAWVRMLHGNYHLRQNNYPEALGFYHEALRLYEQTGFHRGVGDCYNGIGSIYYSLKDFDKAAQYFGLAAPAFEKAGNLEGVMVVYSNVGSILANQEDYRGAIQQTLKAERIVREKKLLKYEAAIYADLTRYSMRIDSFEQARWYAEKARISFERSKDWVEYGNHLYNMSILYLHENDIDKAEAYAQQGLDISIKEQSKSLASNMCVQLQDIYLRRAKATAIPALKDSFFLRAFEFNARDRLYKDSLFNTEKSGQVAAIQVKYETEKKEREISQLNAEAKNREIEILRREVQLRQEKIKTEQARQHTLLLEKNNANFSLQLAVQESRIREQNADARDKQHEIESLNSEKQRREAEVARERQLRYGLLAGLIALALIVFLLLRLYWLKATANRQIKEQQREIEAKNERLAEANRFKSIFLSNMSHEIRTPLNTVIGMSGLLSDTPLNPKQREYVEVVKDASENLLTVINEILDFSKIEAGKIEFQPRLFDLPQLLQRQINLLRFAAEQKNLQLQLHCTPDLPRSVVGDPGRLNQILLNLLGNAVKFTEHGSVTLTVSAVEQQDAKALLGFEVRDTGVGIAAAELPHIFDAFQQAGEDTHLRHSGTGLGLAITQQLVELQGGQLTVESDLGKGSAFRFTLPIGLADLPPASDEVSPEQTKLPARRILLVEDNRFNQMLAIELFQKIIHTPYIVIAQNGVEAIEKSKNEAFDLIFMDVKMPIMDGFTATRSLRAAGLRTPIIALTANATADEQEKCRREGMDDYLAKPIELPLLRQAIIHWATST